MKKIFLALVCVCLLTHCDWFSGSSSTRDSSFEVVDQAVRAFSLRKLDFYFAHFDNNINVFDTNGLGTARVASGIEDFKKYTQAMHKAKYLKLEILEHFTNNQWVFVKQRLTLNQNVMEAAVGYRLVNGKIADIMIVGEKKIE